ncbi:helix-turn-helix transcriptional regulator [Chitinophaga rhizophila]|uniref:AraC family transcriptional regulator n=1 Tax=Chitinophaga rhizophila TaxID=2866212 RepID=A0ABS7GF81_9BACT|nr:AraC family transcriptional regulator [Chitinophaga rhizophila]MBW8686336.1 AraC family transcriptional regulator [Chitinophaga rhizophila]
MNVTIEYGIVGVPEHHIKVTHQLPPQYAAYRCDFSEPILMTSPAVDIIYHTAVANGCSLTNNVFVVKEPVQLLPKAKDPLSTLCCMIQGSINMSYANLTTIPLLQGQYNCFHVTGPQQPTLFVPGVYEVQYYQFSRDLLAYHSNHSKLASNWVYKIDMGMPAHLTPTPGIIWEGMHHLNRELKFCIVNTPLRRTWLAGKLQELLILVLEQQDSSIIPSSQDVTFNTIKAFISNNLDKELSISQLASTYFISASKLRQSFIKYCGMSFSDYQLKVRLERARSLCIDRDVSIAHIAYIVGYKNPSALTKVYKNYYGETPSETRRSRSSE